MDEELRLAHLARAAEILSNLPDPDATWEHGTMMRTGVEAMNGLLSGSKAAVSLPRPTTSGYLRRQAVLIGLAVRLVKLYEGQLTHIADRRMDLVVLLLRSFFETGIYLAYLLRRPSSSCDNYIRTSFQPEKEKLRHLMAVRAERPLLPIEKRMLEAIKKRLTVAGVSQNELLNRHNWKLDGKSMRDILDFLEWPLAYRFGFAQFSHNAHGSWDDLLTYHLKHSLDDPRKYYPSVDFEDSKPGLIGPTSVVFSGRILEVATKFTLDPADNVTTTLIGYAAWFAEFDHVCEVQAQQNH
jgi:hypothetical protein